MDEVQEAQDQIEWAARVEIDGLFHSTAREAAKNAWELLKAGEGPVVEVWPQDRPANWVPVKIDLSVPDPDEALAVLRAVAREVFAKDGPIGVNVQRLGQAINAFARLDDAIGDHGLLPRSWRPHDEYSPEEKAEYGAEMGGKPASGSPGLMYDGRWYWPVAHRQPIRRGCVVQNMHLTEHVLVARSHEGTPGLWRCSECGNFQVF